MGWLFLDELLEKGQNTYINKAKGLIANPQKILGLVNIAIKKANDKKGNLGEVWDKLQLFFELVIAYSKGEYKNISTSTLITIIGAILYFVSPLDLVPDFIIGLGILDDAAVIGYTVKKISAELDHFNHWKKTKTQEHPL